MNNAIDERGSRSGLFKIAPPQQMAGIERGSAASSVKPEYAVAHNKRGSNLIGHESNQSPSMYKNSAALSRLEADGTGLSLPPLIPSGEPSPRMSIVNEGLTSRRNSNLANSRIGGGTSKANS